MVVDQARVLGADDHLCAGQIGEYLIGADCVYGSESLAKAHGDDHEVIPCACCFRSTAVCLIPTA